MKTVQLAMFPKGMPVRTKEPAFREKQKAIMKLVLSSATVTATTFLALPTIVIGIPQILFVITNN